MVLLLDSDLEMESQQHRLREVLCPITDTYLLPNLEKS